MRLGPGTYEAKKVRDDTCLIDYKISLKKTEQRMNLERIDRDIGPGHYYAKDDLVKPKLLGFKIVAPVDETMKEFKEIDRKLPLNINYDAVDKRLTGGLINPQPTSENPLRFIQELEDNRTVRWLNEGSWSLRS